MQITFDVPFAFEVTSPSPDDAVALRVLLECLISLNMAYLRNHPVTSLYRSGVVYARTDEWLTIPALYDLGYGDCKSLACALVAEYRKAGKFADPVFRWLKRVDGSKLFHILVKTEKGYEDPSRKLGMGKDENAYFD